MKKNYFLGLLFCILIFQNSTWVDAQNIDNSEIELVLISKGENFIWGKGKDLNLRCKIINKSQQELTFINPKKSREFQPDLFKIELPTDFRGNMCEFEVGRDQFADTSDFFHIKSGEEKEFLLIGRNYFLNYCNDEKALDSINIFLLYKGKKNVYNKNSYYITKNYKTELSEDEEKSVKDRVESMINKYYSDLTEDEKEKKRKSLQDNLKKDKIKYSPEGQEMIINLYNNLYPKTIKSNTIPIKIEK